MSVAIEFRRHLSPAPWTYSELDQRQRAIAARLASGSPDARGALLLSEVAPVVTLGRRAVEAEELAFGQAWLAARGVEVLRTDRGGLATYHGPGQWVLFAVDRLQTLTGDARGVRRAVEGLLEVARRAASAAGVSAVEIRSGAQLGVWTPRGKLASVGVKVERGILLHGLALNGFRTPLSFLGTRPCGLDAPVDFVFPEPDEAGFSRLGEILAASACEIFWSAPCSRA